MEQFLYLNTAGWKTGRRHRIEIWFVEHGGKYYIMSEGGERAHWVRNTMHNSKVSFSIAGKSFSGTAKVIKEGNAEVKKLMKAKYGWDAGLIVELAPG
jgi:deazaflavin-dependent oxidoreductase (nitroreductase family)